MLKHDGINYYSVCELANIINNPKNELEKQFSELWSNKFNRNKECFTTFSYVQYRLYTPSRNNEIKYISFKKKNNEKLYKCYSIQDVINFLNIEKIINSNDSSIYDLKIHEVENV